MPPPANLPTRPDHMNVVKVKAKMRQCTTYLVINLSHVNIEKK